MKTKTLADHERRTLMKKRNALTALSTHQFFQPTCYAKRKNLHRQTMLLLTFLFLKGCSEALPRPDERSMISEALHTSKQAAQKAQAAANQAHEERERAQAILKEAQTIVSRAEEAQQRCEASVRSLSKSKKKKIFRRTFREPPPLSPTTTPSKGSEKKPEAEPEHSKSDAPVEHKH